MKKFLLTILLSTLSLFTFANRVVESEKYDNGNTKYELIAVPGVDGETFEYHSYYIDGSKEIVGTYNEIGNKSGFWISYYENGQMETQTFYSNGIKHGNAWQYDEDGSVISHAQYKQGKKHGKWTHYDRDGNLISEREYKRDKRHGEWTYYDGGRLLVSQEYSRGKLLQGWQWSEDKGLVASHP